MTQESKRNIRVVIYWVVACLAMVTVAAACGTSDAQAKSNKPQTNVTTVTDDNNYGDYDYREIVVNGRHCIQAVSDSNTDVALSCDWSQK